MQQVLWRLKSDENFAVAKINLQSLKGNDNLGEILCYITVHLSEQVACSLPAPNDLQQFEAIFTHKYLDKPLILILDEFDALTDDAIGGLVNVFRNIYIQRFEQTGVGNAYALHGVALIGVRAVLGVENQSGSPFNVQRSLHIPNLTEAEVNEMYHWYERESGQEVTQAVIDRVFYETRGQPGLVSWLGELLTETYNETPEQPLTVKHFERVYNLALHALPNNNLLNIVSKARQEPYKATVLELFRTEKETTFRYEDPQLNFLYLNGVIDWEEQPGEQGLVIKFPCPFVQKRLFHYFAGEIAYTGGRLYDPFEDLSDTITEDSLNVPILLRRCETYFRENRTWLFKDAPRRADLRLYEAVYHFNLYMYLAQFMRTYDGQVFPEFPTGNGKVDLIIRYAGRRYVVEVKSFSTQHSYRKALGQAARYAQQLGLDEITLALFIDIQVDDANRAKYEAVYEDAETGVTVHPVFVETGEG
jgi:hypothetical protein